MVRGDLEDRKFIVFWRSGGVVSAAMSVNVWDVVDHLKAIVSVARPADPRRLADASITLEQLTNGD